MKFHLIFPNEGHRLLRQDPSSVIGTMSRILSARDGERTILIARSDITKAELIADLKDAIEYAKKDL